MERKDKMETEDLQIILKDSLYHQAGGEDLLPVTKAIFTWSDPLFQPPTTHHFPAAHAFLRKKK